jgi:hypothetical protein
MERSIELLRKGIKMVIDGVECNVEISPCCFMHNGYPIQVKVTIAAHRQTGGIFLRKKGVTVQTAAENDVAELLDQVKIGKCSCCNGPRLIDVEQTNRGQLCENCFMAELDAECDKDRQREAQQFAKECAKQKAAGFTHHITFSVYDGGSDRVYTMFTTGSEESVKKMIAKKYRGQIDFGKFVQL